MPRERSEDRVRGRGRGGGRGKGRGDGRERFRGDDEGKGKKKKGASIKSNIRGIERLLSVKGGSLPESVKRDKEEQLEVLKRMHDERNRRVKTRKIKLRYRRIKFFGEKERRRGREKEGMALMWEATYSYTAELNKKSPLFTLFSPLSCVV